MDLAIFWLYLELAGWLGRRRRARRAAAVEVPKLSLAAHRGCACTFCGRERVAS